MSWRRSRTAKLKTCRRSTGVVYEKAVSGQVDDSFTGGLVLDVFLAGTVPLELHGRLTILEEATYRTGLFAGLG